MAVPIYTDVTGDFRFHIGDTEVSGGQVWTDASGKIDPYIQQAYSELYKGFEGAGVENIQRTLYGLLPAYTSYIDPNTFGASSFSEPTAKPLWEREAGTTATITGAAANTSTPGAPYVRLTTSAPHAFTTGQMLLIFGILGLSDDVNDIWSVSIPDSTHIDLLGCTASGTYSGGGTAAYSTQDWTEVTDLAHFDNYPPAGGALSRYQWVGNRFRVYPANVARQIKMVFYLSGKAPTNATPSASFGFDDSRGFLAYRAAALAANDRGYASTFERLNLVALGPTGIHQDWGGLFGLLMRSKARSAARSPVVLGGYRNARRNAGFALRY